MVNDSLMRLWWLFYLHSMKDNLPLSSNYFLLSIKLMMHAKSIREQHLCSSYKNHLTITLIGRPKATIFLTYHKQMSHTPPQRCPITQTADVAEFLQLLFVRSCVSLYCSKAQSAHFHPQLYHKPIYPHCVGVREDFGGLPWQECSAHKAGCTWSSGACSVLWDCTIEMELRRTQCLIETMIDERNLPPRNSHC